MPVAAPTYVLTEFHDDGFDVISDQALKYAQVMTVLRSWLDDRKQHREATSGTVMRAG